VFELIPKRNLGMKKLILVRHGDCTADGELTMIGCLRISSLALKLKSILHVITDVIILSSTATRAMQSARVLAKGLPATIEGHEVLWSDDEEGLRVQLPEALTFVRSRMSHDVVILVTHQEYTEDFPGYFGQQELNDTRFHCEALRRSEAWVIDCTARTRIRLTC
jgi:phosphohistidine phosphatase SixA